MKIHNAWKIVDLDDEGNIKTLFHGYNGSRIIPVRKWLTSERKTVRDGMGRWYESGWHVFLSYLECCKYLKRFKKKRYIRACYASGIRKKEHSRGDVYLAKKILLW